MADGIILKLTGAKQGVIKGECKKENHEGEIDIMSCDFGITIPADMSRGGSGSITGMPQLQVISFTKKADAASGKILNSCFTNETITEAKVYFTFKGGETLEYQTITLTNSMFTSFHQSGHETGEPTESFSLTCSKFEYEYKEQVDDDGTLGGGIVATYDVKRT
jgi:type VI secretion system secreted protein Hcp